MLEVTAMWLVIRSHRSHKLSRTKNVHNNDQQRLDNKPSPGYIIGAGTLPVLAKFQPRNAPMKFECLHILLRRHPDAVITNIDYPNQSIFFTEKGRQWVMIFDGYDMDTLVGVWEMTSTDWAEQAQDQQEDRQI